MENKNLPTKTAEVAKLLNTQVYQVISDDTLQGFEKAYQIASATMKLKEMLTPEYMKPIMALQGSKLGFKTDKDDKGGYPESVVKDCLIEAVLYGLQPYGNQFNIIAGSMYATKEGFGYLLMGIKGLNFKIVPELPRIKEDKSSAAIVMNIEWTINGVKETEKIDLPIKSNAYVGFDGIIGKGTRKARAWLYNTIKKTELGDADVQDVDYKVVNSRAPEATAEEKEQKRIILLIADATSPDELLKHEKHAAKDPVLQAAFNEKMAELKAVK